MEHDSIWEVYRTYYLGYARKTTLYTMQEKKKYMKHMAASEII